LLLLFNIGGLLGVTSSKFYFFPFLFFFLWGAREKEIHKGKPTEEDWDSGTSIILFYAPWRLDVAGA
jgi:hypothetical protein